MRLTPKLKIRSFNRLILLLGVPCSLSVLALPAPPHPYLVVIDPGHGGQDHGAVQSTSSVAEKDLTLELSREVAKQLQNFGIRSIMTRNGDYDVPLMQRTAMANRLKANVFISIHMNSAQNLPNGYSAEGIETYILNNSSDASSKRLADLENSILAGSVANRGKSGTNPSQKAGAPDPKEQSDVSLIVKDLILDGNLTESKRLACTVHRRMVAATARSLGKVNNRGVKQALFYVLLGADMPSILVEAGFIQNPRDRALLSSPVGRTRIATEIARAIHEFREQKGTRTALSTLSRCQVH